MSPTFLRIFTLFMAIAATLAAKATPGPRTYLNSIWAYGENVTASLRLNHKQNNLRFFL